MKAFGHGLITIAVSDAFGWIESRAEPRDNLLTPASAQSLRPGVYTE